MTTTLNAVQRNRHKIDGYAVLRKIVDCQREVDISSFPNIVKCSAIATKL